MNQGLSPGGGTPPAGDGGNATMRGFGFGCGALGVLMMLSGAVIFILLVTRVLKRTFHIRMQTANALGTLSVLDFAVGFVVVIVAVVLLIVGRKKA